MIPEATRIHHAKLSLLNSRFLEEVESDPSFSRRSSFEALDQPSDLIQYPLQSWPLFINGETVRAIEHASVGLCRLLKRIPEAIFGNDPKRIAEFYHLDPAYGALLVELLRDGATLRSLVGRGDFVLTSDGFRCLEFNMTSRLGGWNSVIWSKSYEQVPLVGKFLDQHRAQLRFRDTLRHLFTHVREEARRRGMVGEELNIAFAIPAENRAPQRFTEFMSAEYERFVEDDPKLRRGEILVCDYPDLEQRDWQLYLGEHRVHILLEDHGGEVEHKIFSCVMAGTLDLYNGPLTNLLDDKRNLALLSEAAAGGDALSAEERALVEATLPWTRTIAAGETSYGGERVEMVDFLLAERERMVIKPALSGRGIGVHLGPATAPETWAEVVTRAARDETGSWIVQEYAESLPLFFQNGEEGARAHDVIWGFFVFGEDYGGGFLRMMPQGAGEVINAARGASEGVFWEVDDEVEAGL